MNDPVLQIRLKKQLSGGRVPHLLQERVHRNKSEKYSESTYAHYVATNFPPTPCTMKHSMFSDMHFCSCNKEAEGGGNTSSHPTIKPLTFHLLHTASSLGMGNVCRRERQETVNTGCLCSSSRCLQSLLSWLQSHTHILQHMDENIKFRRLKITLTNFRTIIWWILEDGFVHLVRFQSFDNVWY